MTTPVRRAIGIGLYGLLLATSLAWAEPACLQPREGGIGGLGDLAQGGISGTGMVAQGGIGGTGSLAEGGIGGTGIVGTITGFASVCVNGLEVHYDATTPVISNGRQAQVAHLALGQVVSIEARPGKRGLEAAGIAILHALEGPITGLSPEFNLIYVLGQPVKVGVETLYAGIESLEDIQRGEQVRVSGYRNAAGTLLASRIDFIEKLDEVSVIGEVGPRQASVAGMAVSGSLPAVGSEVLVRGHWDGKRLVAGSVKADPTLPFANRVERIVAEGIVQNRAGARRLSIAGFEVELDERTAVSGGGLDQAREGQRVRISGRLSSGRKVQATRIEIMRSMGMQRSGPGASNPSGGVQAKPSSALEGGVTSGSGSAGPGGYMYGQGAGFGGGGAQFGGAGAGAAGAGSTGAMPGRGGPASGGGGRGGR